MASEMTIADWSADNSANVNFQPFTLADIDTTNSNNTTTAVLQATNATGEWIGVVYDQAKLTSTGTVVAGQAIALRTNGIAKITCSAAITVGAYVNVTNTSGQVGPATQTAGGSQPKPIVGRALTSTSASGDLVLVYLMPGVRF